MIRSAVAERLRDEYGRDGLVYPAYDSYCFARIPDTVESLLSAGGSRPLPDDVFDGVGTDASRVVVVLVDGYGLDSWRRDRDHHDLLDRLSRRGRVTPLTSIYPSETAAAITTFETGTLPAQHSSIGWNVYDPQTDRSFVSLSGEVKRGDEPGSIAPEAAPDVETVYPGLSEAGIDCHRLQPFDRQSPDVTQHTYDGLDALGSRLLSVVEKSTPPAYVYAYLPDIDAISHDAGTHSPEFQETLRAICGVLESWLDGLSTSVAAETLLVVTADHGHVDTDPARNVDLSERARLMECLERHDDGSPVTMAGSPRNVHLHIRDGTDDKVRRILSDLDATLVSRETAIDSDLFGDCEPTDRFRRRCGDLVCTPRRLGTWFGDEEPDELELVGMHGGLHPREMLVPFAAVRADRLQ